MTIQESTWLVFDEHQEIVKRFAGDEEAQAAAYIERRAINGAHWGKRGIFGERFYYTRSGKWLLANYDPTDDEALAYINTYLSARATYIDKKGMTKCYPVGSNINIYHVYTTDRDEPLVFVAVSVKQLLDYIDSRPKRWVTPQEAAIYLNSALTGEPVSVDEVLVDKVVEIGRVSHRVYAPGIYV